MNSLITILAAVIPSAVLVHHFYRQDKRKPEPLDKIIKLFFLGLISLVLVLVPERILVIFFDQFITNSLANNFLIAFVVAALCEESIKFIIVRKFIYNDDRFDEIKDGIFYTIVVALGFACAENIWYVVNYGIEIIQVRALFAVPLHASASGIMGYYIGKAKFSQSKKEERDNFVKGLCIAIAIHGLYDFVVFVEGSFISFIINAIILIAAFKFLYNKINVAILENEINENSKSSSSRIAPKIQEPISTPPVHPLFKKEIENIADKKKVEEKIVKKGYKKGDLYNK